jgi:hypothetical protein
MRLITALSACALVAGCSSSPDEAPPAPERRTEGDLEHLFGSFELAPGEEVSDLCASWTVGNDEPLFVNAVELVTDGGFHHSNWFFVPEAHLEGEDGLWRCDDRGFNQPIAAALGGVLFAQSTQSDRETQRFGQGFAVPVPARVRIVGNLHLLNTTAAPKATTVTLGVYTVPEVEVTTKLAAMSFDNTSLAIPPSSRSEFTTECNLAAEHQEQLGRPLDFNVFYLLPHYHSLGVSMRIEAFGQDGSTVMFDAGSPVGDPLGQMMDPAFGMTGFEGLRFTCVYDNPRAETVGHGIGDQEMCTLLAFTDSALLWGGGSFGEPAEPEMVDGVARFQTDCGVLSYPAAHER